MTERKKEAYSRKGNITLEVAFIGVGLFVLLFAMIMLNSVTAPLYDDIANDTNTYNETLAALGSSEQAQSPVLWDNILIFFFAMTWGGAVIAAKFIDAHPIYWIASFFLLIIIAVASLGIMEAYDDFENDADLQTFAVQYPKSSFIMHYLLYFVIAMGTTIGIALYGKQQ